MSDLNAREDFDRIGEEFANANRQLRDATDDAFNALAELAKALSDT